MLFAIIGENCSGKSTLADELCRSFDAQVVTGKDYLRMAKNEAEAIALFQAKLKSSVNGDDLIYVIADPDHLKLLPEGAVRILVSADLDTIKARFRERMRGVLPEPVARMLENKHGIFDSEPCDYRFDGATGNPVSFCESLKKEINGK